MTEFLVIVFKGSDNWKEISHPIKEKGFFNPLALYSGADVADITAGFDLAVLDIYRPVGYRQ